jgi:hypothetical protein
MRKLTPRSARIIRTLTTGLQVGEGRKISNSDTYMPVSVNRLSEKLFSVTHYYEQNGDLVPDPDMTFYTPDEGQSWFACSFQNAMTYNEAVVFDRNGEPEKYNRHLQADMTRFANTWMGNIRAQQQLGIRRVA